MLSMSYNYKDKNMILYKLSVAWSYLSVIIKVKIYTSLSLNNWQLLGMILPSLISLLFNQIYYYKELINLPSACASMSQENLDAVFRTRNSSFPMILLVGLQNPWRCHSTSCWDWTKIVCHLKRQPVFSSWKR